MPKHSPIRGRDLIKLLTKQGFRVVRQRGSHVRLEHADGRKTTVSVHSGEMVGRGLLRKILHDVNLTPEQFARMR